MYNGQHSFKWMKVISKLIDFKRFETARDRKCWGNIRKAQNKIHSKIFHVNKQNTNHHKQKLKVVKNPMTEFYNKITSDMNLF